MAACTGWKPVLRSTAILAVPMKIWKVRDGGHKGRPYV
jgi:hypothetical protein